MESTILFETIDKIRKIGSPNASVFNSENKYSRAVYLVFRFEGLKKDDAIYSELKSIIEEFKGNHIWYMKNIEEHKNYIIIPKYFYDNNLRKISPNEEIPVGFKDNVDKAIEDLQHLIKFIEQKFKL